MNCADVFSLPLMEWKSCRCGKVKGRYLADMHSAETNGEGVCIALHNHYLHVAIRRLNAEAFSDDYEDCSEELSFKAWVRPHEGPGNPRSKVVK
jgi:hypothetical protein